MAKSINFTKITLRKMITTRGGGIEIDLHKLGYPNQKMTAYQNYLGGGMLGAVSGDCTVKTWKADEKLYKIQQELREHFFNLTNEDESNTFEENQKLSISSY